MSVLLGKPLVLHEQNSVAGMANKVLAGVADRVFTAFPNVLKKASWVGNPLRAAFLQQPRPGRALRRRARARCRLLVVGGSLGAKALNDIVPKALALIPAGAAAARCCTRAAPSRSTSCAPTTRPPACRPNSRPSSTTRRRPSPRPTWCLPRRRQHRHRDRGRRRGGAVRAVPARGGRPPDHQREVPGRRGRRLAGAAARPHARSGWRDLLQHDRARANCSGAPWRPRACKKSAPRPTRLRRCVAHALVETNCREMKAA